MTRVTRLSLKLCMCTRGARPHARFKHVDGTSFSYADRPRLPEKVGDNVYPHLTSDLLRKVLHYTHGKRKLIKEGNKKIFLKMGAHSPTLGILRQLSLLMSASQG